MKKGQDADPWAVGWAIRTLILVSFIAAFTVPTGLFPIIAAGTSSEEVTTAENGPIVIPLGPSFGATTTPVAAQVTLTPHTPHVGIIAGHSGGIDTGAVCDDGLKEVTINFDIAHRVVALLSQRGWDVELLEEFDPRLNGYKADALVSIHADSCNVPGKSGFKVARAQSSYIPVAEDRLVDCLSRYYAERTGLAFDANTITYDMTQYHAYGEIDHSTPAAIIEVGFMLDDRELLTMHPEIPAQGIADGIVCFIEGTSP